MGKIDTETKAFMSNPARFADPFNYLIYGGQPVIKPEDLKPLDTTEIAIPYGNNVRAHKQKYRDVLKLLTAMQDAKRSTLWWGWRISLLCIMPCR